MARELWSFAHMTFGVLWMMPGQVIYLLIVYRGVSGRHRKGLCGKLLRITLFVLYRERERNRWNFANKEQSMQDIKYSFLRFLFEYCMLIGGYHSVLF